MQLALGAAESAAALGEVPIGACLYLGDECLAVAHNQTVSSHDPCGHAEVLALRQAAQRLKNHRTGGTLYVTLQPCLMCLGALMNARVERVVIGASDSRYNSNLDESLQAFRRSEAWHDCRFETDCLPEASQALLKTFFQSKRPPRSQTLAQLKSLMDLPNVNKDTVKILHGLSIHTGADLLARGLPNARDAILALLPSLAQLPLAQAWGADILARQKATLLSLCDFLDGLPVKPWASYLPPNE